LKIFIVGLGLIGGSYAQRLSEKHTVYGYDKSATVLGQALTDRCILDSNLNLISESDVVILCLYPNSIIEFIKTNINLFNKTQLITDVSGIKKHQLTELETVLDGYNYLSHHPMAGSHLSTYYNRSFTLFEKANFLITYKDTYNNDSVLILKELSNDLGFEKCIVINYLDHDELITLTSELPHIIASSLINVSQGNVLFYSGDSFRDLTRIAKMNPTLWSELFILNKDNNILWIEKFIKVLSDFKEILINNNLSELRDLIKQNSEKKEIIDNNYKEGK
jgi:prephenate dehydrogenase